MPKNKRPVPRKASITPEERDHAVTKQLCDLALDLVEQEDGEQMSAVLRQKEADFQKLIKKTLTHKKDEVLYEAIDRATYEDIGAYQFLRSQIEEAAATMVIRREGSQAMEINAFAIPLFVHSTGGLVEADEFQDDAAFTALTASLQSGGLESAQAKVVLIRHAYDLDEIDSITYCQLNEMVYDAWSSMTDKKIIATPALERSITGWSPTGFGAQDSAVELRFLLGFALKRTDDPFYRVPADDNAADTYFAARMERYQAWTAQAGDLVRRCLAPAGAPLEINFLYQDLFHGAKEQGVNEYFMLQMLSEINQALDQHGLAPDQAKAVLAPADTDGQMLLRVQLQAVADGAVLLVTDKPLDLAADLTLEVADLADALATLGIRRLAVALRFDASGQALEEKPYQPDGGQ